MSRQSFERRAQESYFGSPLGFVDAAIGLVQMLLYPIRLLVIAFQKRNHRD